MELLPVLCREHWLHRSRRQCPSQLEQEELWRQQQEEGPRAKEEALRGLEFLKLLVETECWVFGNKEDRAEARDRPVRLSRRLRLSRRQRRQQGLKLRPWRSERRLAR